MKLPPENLESKIYSTLAFFALFGRRLSLDELKSNFMGGAPSDLSDIANYHFIEKINGTFGLKTVEYKDFSEKLSDIFWLRVFKFVRLAQFIPFIRMIAVCNNLALGTVNEDSDIDLFIITSKNRIFLARTLITLFYHLLGVRRHGDKVKARLCLSFFVSEEGLDLKNTLIENDIYFYYWFKSLKPIFGSNTLKIYKDANKWIDSLFPNFQFDSIYLYDSRFLIMVRRCCEFLLNLGFAQIFEILLSWIHVNRFNTKKTEFSSDSSIVISKTMLKFHNLDRRKYYRDKWLMLCEKLN